MAFVMNTAFFSSKFVMVLRWKCQIVGYALATHGKFPVQSILFKSNWVDTQKLTQMSMDAIRCVGYQKELCWVHPTIHQSLATTPTQSTPCDYGVLKQVMNLTLRFSTLGTTLVP